MCGPSGSMKTDQTFQESLTNLLEADYNERFAQQSDILNNMMRLYTPIAEAGPSQQGMSAQQLAAENTQAIEGTGREFAKASQVLNNQLAARGGGNEVLPSGAADQLKEQLASAAAAQSSQEQLAITNENYNLGRQNWKEATVGLRELAGVASPLGYGQAASNSNDLAFKEATEIQQMKNQAEAEIAGGITTGVMDAASFGAGALGGGGFDFAGGLQALTGKG